MDHSQLQRDEAVTLASLAEARCEALMRILAILAAEGCDPPQTRNRSIVIVDAAGCPVAMVTFDEAVSLCQATQ